MLKKSQSLMVFALGLSVQPLLAQTEMSREFKVVYGDDDRIEVYQADEKLQKIAKASAAMISLERLTKLQIEVPEGEEDVAPELKKILYQLDQTPMTSYGICESERFADQPNPASCSTFLVGPDLLVTAGHCIKPMTCLTNAFVFNFHLDKQTKTAGMKVDPKDIYRCTEVINFALSRFTKADYALLKLDRVVEGVEPLSFRTAGKVDKGTDLIVVGHPTGLPTKIAPGGKVRDNEDPFYFVASLDTFQGNSGSLVVNAKDHTVEGILVRGETDYVRDEEKGCHVVNVCEQDECRGEDVSRIDGIIELRMRDKILDAAKSGDMDTIADYLVKGGYIHMYNNQKQNMLMVAIESQRPAVVEELIRYKIDVSANDLSGRNIFHYLASASGEDEKIISLLMEYKEIGLDKKDNNGLSPLAISVISNKGLTSNELINQGADAKVIVDDVNLVVKAFENKNIDLVKVLVNAGADVDFKDLNGKSSLIKAVETNDTTNTIALLELGADAKVLVGDENLVVKAFENKNIELVKALVTAGADINFKDKTGRTLLAKTVEENDSINAIALIELGADVKVLVGDENLVVKAFENKNIDLVKALVVAGADVDYKDQMGKTSLVKAVEANDLISAIALLELKADPKKVTGDSLIFKALEFNNEEMIKSLVEAGEGINLKNQAGSTLLELSVLKNNEKMAKFLIDQQADVNAELIGESLLIKAIRTKNTEMISLLLKSNIDLEVKSVENFKPAKLARKLKLKDVRKLINEEIKLRKKAARLARRS